MAIDLKHHQEDVNKHQRESLGPFNGDGKHLFLLQEMCKHIQNDRQNMYRKECVEYGLASGKAFKQSCMVIFMATLSGTVNSGSCFDEGQVNLLQMPFGAIIKVQWLEITPS